MPSRAIKAASLRESWRPDSASAERIENRKRIVRRLLVTLCLAVLAAAFGYLLFAPFFHPTTRLYYFTAGAYESLDVDPIPYYQDDAVRFLTLNGIVSKREVSDRFFAMDTPESVRQSVRKLAESDLQPSDVALVSMSAHPVVIGSKPLLACSNYEPARPESGTVSIEEILELMRRTRAGTIILCLDIGNTQWSRFGELRNDEFLMRLRDSLNESSSKKQWIIVSNSNRENSYFSTGLKGSVFSCALEKAIQGEADFNRDSAIDLDELYRFIYAFTHSHAERESGNKATQSPLLLTTLANQNVAPAEKIIASVDRRSTRVSWWDYVQGFWASADEPAKEEAAQQEDEKIEEEKNWLSEWTSKKRERIKELSMDELEDNINFLPDFLRARVKKSLGIEEEQVDESAYAKVGEKPSSESNESAVEPSADSEPLLSEERGKNKPSNKVFAGNLPDLSKLGDPKLSNLQLLLYAWQYFEFLGQPQTKQLRPLDLAPHAWGEMRTYLHGIEKRLRTGAVLDAGNLRIQLVSEIAGTFQFSTTRKTDLGTMAKRLSSQMPNFDLPALAMPSVGLAESLANFGGPAVPVGLQSQIEQFDASIASDTSELHSRWIKQVPKDASNQYCEFFWAQRFSTRPHIPWSITRRLLSHWRELEKLSYDPLNSSEQIQNELLQLQQTILESSRIAIDQIGANWSGRCEQSLAKADQLFTNIREKSSQWTRAFQSRNQYLGDLREFVRWLNIADSRLGIKFIEKDLKLYFDHLERLCELWLMREESDLSEVIRTRQSLDASAKRIQNIWVDEAKALLTDNAKNEHSKDWVANSLLATTLETSQIRNRLLMVPNRELEPSSEGMGDSDVIPPRHMMVPPQERPAPPLDFEQRTSDLAGVESTVKSAMIATDRSRFTQASTSDAAADLFYADLGNQIRALVETQGRSSPETLRQHLIQLRKADQSVRLLPTARAHAFDGLPLENRLWRLEFLQCLGNQKNALERSIQDASPSEAMFQRNSLERLRAIANVISGQSGFIALTPSRLTATGTTSISLASEPESSGEVIWRNNGRPISNGWLVVQYDSELLELQGPTGISYSYQDDIPKQIRQVRQSLDQDMIALLAIPSPTEAERQRAKETKNLLMDLTNALEYPVNPAVSRLAPSVGLGSGQEIRIPFKVRRTGLGPDETKVVWKLVGDNEYVRHEVNIQLPASEKLLFVVDADANSWARTPEGVVLFPWPNRTTGYRFGLRNESSQTRTLSVELQALVNRSDLQLPQGLLSENAYREIYSQLGELRPIASIPEIALPKGEETLWLPWDSPLFALPDAAPKSAVEPASINMNDGLLVTITDKTTNQKCFRRIDSRVRHPRSYVEPMVSFDADAERVEVRLNLTQSSGVLSSGVAIKGRIVEPLPRGTEMRLDGNIVGKESTVLYCQLPEESPRELTMELDVDGFPRAFVFRVPCWRTMFNVPINSDLQRIEIVEPSSGLLVGSDQKPQKVRLKIDAIPGSFETKRDFVQLGWDIDRDREFDNENTIVFAADRAVKVDLKSLAGGRFMIETKIDDVTLEMPPPPVTNQRVNLLAKLASGGEIAWSVPVEVIADTLAPKVTGVELDPGMSVKQGSELTVRVGVDDFGLSEVNRVEVLIDSKGIGKFEPDAGAPKDCQRDSDGTWNVVMPVAEAQPGRSTLLVRATDRVGNVSEISKTILEIVSEQDWEQRMKSAVQEITGSVTYLDNPLTNAKVTFEDEKGKTIYRSTTDARGMFRIPNVAAGKYKIIAIGTVKNHPRKSEKQFEVMAPPSPPPRLRLVAK